MTFHWPGGLSIPLIVTQHAWDKTSNEKKAKGKLQLTAPVGEVEVMQNSWSHESHEKSPLSMRSKAKPG